MTVGKLDMSTIREKIRDTIANELGLKPEHLGPHPAMYRSAGWDSLMALVIVEAVEALFGIVIDDTEIERSLALDTLTDLVAAKLDERTTLTAAGD